MRFKSFFILLSVFFISLKASAQDPSSNFKIVGYYSINAAMKADTSQVPFKKLTHINLAFMHPDVSGNFNQNFDALIPFIQAAHRHNVKVLYSIGGGGRSEEYHALLKQNKKRQELISSMVSKVLEYNVDGIDVDLELGYVFGPNSMAISRSFPRENHAIPGTDPNYGIFIMELAQALRSHNKLTTAALPSRPAEEVITKEVLSQFDHINVMSYDHAGPSRPDRAGHHSSYVDAMDDLDYYINTLMVPKAKVVLGVPFYGRGFGPGLTNPAIVMNYNDIVTTYTGAEWVDHWHLPNGYIMYYNGILTIKNKTELAKKEAGGIMIWQVLGDSPSGEKSLLNAINAAAR